MNAIVLVVRGLGARWPGCYGNEMIETPNLDRLAAEGVVFDRHYADTIADPLPPGMPPQIVTLDQLEQLAFDAPAWFIVDCLPSIVAAAAEPAEALELMTAAVERLDAGLARLPAAACDVVVTADGGVAVGEHGTLGRGGSPYEELMHVPLIVRRRDRSGAGDRVLDLTSSADLQAILGGNVPNHEFVISRNSCFRSIRTADWTLIETPEPRLFQFPQDRFEQSDAARLHPEVAEVLAERLKEIA